MPSLSLLPPHLPCPALQLGCTPCWRVHLTPLPLLPPHLPLPPAGLHSMLAVRTFRQELVLFVSWGETWTLNAVQCWHMWHKHGYAHTLTLMHSEAVCRDLQSRFPDFGCGWANELLPPGVSMGGP